MPDYQIRKSDVKLRAASGTIESAWEIDGKLLRFRFVIPFDTKAEIVLPDASADVIRKAAEEMASARQESVDVESICQDEKNVTLHAGAGSYEFCYEPTTPYRKIYSLDSTWEELKANPKTWAVLEREYKIGRIPFEKELCTLEELTWGPFTGLGMTREKRELLDRLLREVE